mgnify:FL=1
MQFAMQALRPAQPFMAYAKGIKPAYRQLDTWTKVVLVMLTAFVLTIMWSEPAAAQAINLNPIQTFLNSIVTALTGTLGKTIATLALVCVFIGWFMGYIEMRLALYVLVAIVFVGSAATIVNSLWST